jgi:hypothetical protein
VCCVFVCVLRRFCTRAILPHCWAGLANAAAHDWDMSRLCFGAPYLVTLQSRQQYLSAARVRLHSEWHQAAMRSVGAHSTDIVTPMEATSPADKATTPSGVLPGGQTL